MSERTFSLAEVVVVRVTGVVVLAVASVVGLGVELAAKRKLTIVDNPGTQVVTTSGVSPLADSRQTARQNYKETTCFFI